LSDLFRYVIIMKFFSTHRTNSLSVTHPANHLSVGSQMKGDRMRKMTFVTCLVAGFALLIVMGTANADVIITLKNGKTHKVKVDQNDIVSITFEKGRSGRYERPDRDPEPFVTWNFETGQLDGWTTTGTAFNNQPTYGDNPTARNRGQESNHKGDFWIGGFENRPTRHAPAGAVQGDGPKGTMTSLPFVINGPTIGFLVGGGCDMNGVRIELVVNGVVQRQATGRCTETMAHEEWNVSNLMGKEAMIRIVDNASGGWGHINVDEIRFY